MDRLSRALSEIQSCLEEQRRERDEAVRHAAELEVTLESARELSGQREANLVDANSRLLVQVEELSATVARMHSQVSTFLRAPLVSFPSFVWLPCPSPEPSPDPCPLFFFFPLSPLHPPPRLWSSHGVRTVPW